MAELFAISQSEARDYSPDIPALPYSNSQLTKQKPERPDMARISWSLDRICTSGSRLALVLLLIGAKSGAIF